MIRELGRGNFVVYQARDTRDGRAVAIKVARPDDPRGRLRLMSLAREAEKIRALETRVSSSSTSTFRPASRGLVPTATSCSSTSRGERGKKPWKSCSEPAGCRSCA